ncbi:MAG: hypothetical protein ACYC6Y_25440, partial [Thermoguttaceae bacterium]
AGKKGRTMSTGTDLRAELSDAFYAGRRMGFAISALVLSLVGFLTLLGTEKAILAIVLGGLAIRGSAGGSLTRRLGITAIALASLFLVTVAVVLVVFRDQLLEIVVTLQKLS